MNKLDIKKTVKMGALPIAITAMLVGCSNRDSTVVATIDGDELIGTELNDGLQVQYDLDTLDTMLSNEIVKFEADNLNLSATEEALRGEYTGYANSCGNDEVLLAMLSSNNMHAETIEEESEMDLLTFKVMEEYIGLTEDGETCFEENKDSYTQEELLEASKILIATLEKVNGMIKPIESEYDFPIL